MYAHDTAAVATVKKFVEAHGEHVVIGGWRYFADGSRCEAGVGALVDGAQLSPLERWSNIARYRQVMLDRAVRAFDELKAKMLADPNALFDKDKQLSNLTDARQAAQAAKTALDEAVTTRDSHDPTRPTPPTPAQALAFAKLAADRADFNAAVAAIEL